MKAILVPLYFENATDPDFLQQVDKLRTLLANEVEISTPVALGDSIPPADAVVFPQMLGKAYRMTDEIHSISLPRLVITSEFGTVSMWDWEINRYLHTQGITMISPSSLDQTRVLCRALALKRELRQTHFLVYQDNPGAGFQPEIFKRFYWWEAECTQRIADQFGVKITRKSFKELADSAKQIPDSEAAHVWKEWKSRIPVEGIPQRSLYSALKLYLAVKRDLSDDPLIHAVGINCLNESRFFDSTPCLAWNMLFEELGLYWGCEADTVTMLSKMIVHRTLDVPVMMTNLYPFLMGMAALKHEHIPNFPLVAEAPENHILAAHCGYMGVVPQSFTTQWTLRRKVLAIVDENATAIDARMATGEMTLVKLEPDFDTISVVEGMLEGYAQFSNSDCLNGAILRVSDGHHLLEELTSHHYVLTLGHNRVNLQLVAKIFGLKTHII
jgi:hypothetical protein